jgi:hypothetical protein
VLTEENNKVGITHYKITCMLSQRWSIPVFGSGHPNRGNKKYLYNYFIKQLLNGFRVWMAQSKHAGVL